MPSVRFVHLVITLLFAVGCRPQPRDNVTDPHYGDSLARLLRGQLTADDPVPVQTAVGCEMVRLHDLLGLEKADEVIRRVRDTIYHPEDRAARDRMNAKLGPRDYDITCSPQPTTDTTSMHP